jgi:hypothetical protein
MKRFLVIDEQAIKELREAMGREYIPAQYEAVREIMLASISANGSYNHVQVIDCDDDESIAIAKTGRLNASETAKHGRNTADRENVIHSRGSRKKSTGHRGR